MSEKTMEKTMGKIVSEYYHGAIGASVTDIQFKMARCIDALTERIAVLEGKTPYNPAPPAGVYVKPGMRVVGTNGEWFTVRPKIAVSGFKDHIGVWDDHGNQTGIIKKFLTCALQPVLGYEEDKP